MPVSFEINDKQYRTPEGWESVTFDNFLRNLEEVAPLKPIELTNFVDAHLKYLREAKEELLAKNKISEVSALSMRAKQELEQLGSTNFSKTWGEMPLKEKSKCYDFFCIEIGFWCDIDSKIVRESFINLEHLEATYWALFYEMNPDNAKIDEDFAGFDINGTLYIPPIKHMTESTVVEFMESAQFQENMKEIEGGNWLSMLDVMVVLCRPKGEPYEYVESKHEARKRLFRGVTMDNVINTAFFLLRLSGTLNLNLLIYTMEAELIQKELKLLESDTDGLL